MLLDRLSSANCLQAFLWASFRRGFLLGWRLVVVCGVWSEHWQADLPLLQPLKQCWQHLYVCFCKPASAPDAQHEDWTYFIDPYLGKPLYDPGHCTVTQFQVVTDLLIASAIFNSQILREFLAMRCHVELPVVSMRELFSKHHIWTALIIRYTNLYGPVKQTKWIGHVALHG